MKLFSVKMFIRLFWWRLRYFRQTSFRLLERRWQVVFLSMLALAPAAMPFREQLRLLGRPVSLVVEPGHVLLSAAWWLGLLAVARVWTGLQAQALQGGPGWRHLRSLPTVVARGRWVDLAVLAAADLPLLLLFAAAITGALLHRGPAFPAVLAMLALAPQLPLFQSMQLQRISGSLPCLALDLAGMAANAAGWSGWLLPCAAIASTAGGIAFLARPPRHAASASWTLPAWLRLREQWRVECNLALVNFRFLLGERHYAQHIRLAFCALLPVLLQALLRHTSLSTWPPLATAAVLVSLCLPPLILGLSSLATELLSLHAPMLAMQRTLDIRPSHLRTAQLLTLGTCFIPLCTPLMLTLFLVCAPAAYSWRVLAVAPVGMMALAACCWLMEFPYNRVYLPRILVAVLACYGVVHWLPG